MDVEEEDGGPWAWYAAMAAMLGLCWWGGCLGSCLHLMIGTRPNEKKGGFEKLDAAESGMACINGRAVVPAPRGSKKKGSGSGKKKSKEGGGKKVRKGSPMHPALDD